MQVAMFKCKLPCFCLVTGASRGLGREIALQIAGEWDKEGKPCLHVQKGRFFWQEL